MPIRDTRYPSTNHDHVSMKYSAERFWMLADCYQKLAEHDDAPLETRTRFARQANACRVTVRLAAHNEGKPLEACRHASQVR